MEKSPKSEKKIILLPVWNFLNTQKLWRQINPSFIIYKTDIVIKSLFRT